MTRSNWKAADAVLEEVTGGCYRILRDPITLDAETREALSYCTPEVRRAALARARIEEDVCPWCLHDHRPAWGEQDTRVMLRGFRCFECGWRENGRHDPVRDGLLASVKHWLKGRSEDEAAYSPIEPKIERVLTTIRRVAYVGWGLAWLVLIALLLFL